MADKLFDEVLELRLPAKLFRRSVGVAFDFGGSRCKVAFKKRAEKCKSNISDEQLTVVLAGFSLNKLTEALNFVKKNADYSLERTADGHQRQLRITGAHYSQKLASVVETQLNLRAGSVVYAAEFGMHASAISILQKNLAEDDVFYTPPPSPMQMPADSAEKMNSLSLSDKSPQSIKGGTSTSTKSGSDVTASCEAPYLILCFGSGIGITLVSKDGKSELVNGSSQGGVSLHAMSKLLVGTDDFAAFLASAERGNVAEVSTTAGECQVAGATHFNSFPPDAPVHAYGKVLEPDFKAKPDDMARTLLTNAMENTAMLTVWTALAKNCRTVYVCGRIFEHQLPRNYFSYCFGALGFMYGKMVMTCRVLKRGSFIPVLGALLDDCD